MSIRLFAALSAFTACLLPPLSVRAEAEKNKNAPADAPQRIDLAAALRLAGANNLDIKIVEQRLAEAKADHLIALEQFLPALSGGMGFRQHNGNTQTVEGRIIDVNKQLVRAGGTLSAEIQIGEAIYDSLASRQLVRAAKHATETQRQDSTYQAATAFFDLAAAKAAADVANESLRIASDYSGQVNRAIDAGVAFKGAAYQALAQIEKYRLVLEQTQAQQRIAAARLAQVLNLDPAVELLPDQTNLAPISIFTEKASLGSLVGKALAARPELLQADAQLQAAKTSRDGAVYGPAIPTLGAESFWGGLGGGDGNAGADHFNDSSDYFVGVSWKIGPGGLFDLGRIDKAKAQVRQSELENEKYRTEVVRQVVAAQTRMLSLAKQLSTAEKALATAEKFLALTRERKEFDVGEVLEFIDAEKNLSQIKLDYVRILAEHNKAQFGLQRAIGGSLSQARK